MNLIHSPAGGFHLVVSMLAVFLGSWILIAPKGGRTHTVIGYWYLAAMLATNGSAFFLYHLFGTFGPFHFAAIISMLTLLAGILPVLLKRSKHWLYRHMYWMHYSVFGLYAAFASEILTRLPLGLPFFVTVGVGSTLIMVGGALIIQRKADEWATEAKQNLRIR